MNTEILNKPVNMQNLSHALAKVKADYDGKINDLSSNIDIENSDWEETVTTDNAYILNKPAIKAGEGENGVVIGQTEHPEDYTEYTLTINGEASTTTFSYTTEDDLSGLSTLGCYVYYEAGTSNIRRYAKIISIDKTNFTIELSNALSTSEITNGTLLICRRNKNKAIGKQSLAEGAYTLSIGTWSHAEGNSTFAYQSNSHAEGMSSMAMGMNSHAEGNKTRAKGIYSHAEGNSTTASNSCSHSEGQETTASGIDSHAEGYYTTASGNYSHAEGYKTTASGEESHSEGFQSYASGRGSHSEGDYGESSNVQITGDSNAVEYTLTNPIEIKNGLNADDIIKSTSIVYNNNIHKVINVTIENNKITKFTLSSTLSANAINETVSFLFGNVAKGNGSHAEGAAVFAQGLLSHAEGLATQAQGIGSHAEGRGTISQSDYSHAEGKFNIGGNYLHVAGNGTNESNLSNAYTLDWQGNGWYAGKLTVGSAPTENMDVATKQYVDNHVPDLSGYVATTDLETLVTPLIQAALANYGDGDTATYGYVNVNEEEY